MKKLAFWLIFLSVCTALPAFSQSAVIRWDLGAPGSAGAVRTSGAGLPFLLAQPGVKLNWCSHPANAVPCSNYATTYTSMAGTTACANTTQIVLQPGSTCQATGDNHGNLGVYTSSANSTYDYTLTVNGVSYGPYVVSLGGAGGGSSSAIWGAITGNIASQTDLQNALALASTWGNLIGTLSNQTDLQAALDAKADTAHTHDATDIISGLLSSDRLPPPTANTLGGVMGDGTNLTCDSGYVANGFDVNGHINCVLDQTGGAGYTLPALQASTLGGVKGTGASLTCPAGNNANGFQSDGALNCRADTVASVAGRTGIVVLVEADIASLVTDLAGKAPASHTHTESQVTNLVSDLAGKAALVHIHAEADVTNLVADLAAKALNSSVVHNTGVETIGGQKTFSAVPLILTLANGCLNITSGLIGSTGAPCGAGGGGTWGSITGTLSAQTDLWNALLAKANDNAVVHNTGDETIAGQKTWSDNAFFNGFLEVAGGYEVNSDWPGSAMNPTTAAATKLGVDSDGHFKTCEGTAACVAPAVDAQVVHNTGTETIAGAKTFSTSVAIGGLSDGCLNIASGLLGSQACASGSSYSNLFQTSANVLTQQNGVTTQAYQVMDIYTGASNYQGLEIGGNYIKTMKLGTGTSRALILAVDDGSNVRGWQINTSRDLVPYQTATPPNIGTSGSRVGTIFATVFNTPLADGCVQIASNVFGTLSNPCVTSPSDLASRTYSAGGGTAQAQTATLAPVAASGTPSGLIVHWKPSNANTGAAPTLSVNGTTATIITKCGATALVAGDLSTTAVAEVIFDGTQYELTNPQVGSCGSGAGGVVDPGSNGLVARTGAGTAEARTISAAAGLSGSNLDGVSGNPSLSTNSSEANFLNSGALTCGAGTQGKMQVHTTPLEYCDNAATPALQYSAYGDSSGNALSGDSATAFFGAGTLEVARGGTGTGSTLTGLVRGSASAMTAAELSGDATTSGSNAVTVVKINGTSLAGLGTGIVKNTTGTGVPSIAVAGDFPTLNQNTTGTAANLSGTPALPNGTTATTQAANSNDTKTATDAYVDAANTNQVTAPSAAGAANQVALSNGSDKTLKYATVSSTNTKAFFDSVPPGFRVIAAADLPSTLTSGTAITNAALTTPSIGAATGTSLLATGIVDGTAPVTVTTGTSATLGAATYKSGYTFNQEATAGTGVTYTLPATAVGLQYCVKNSIVSGTGAADTGVLTVNPAASSYLIKDGTIGVISHGMTSGGAAGDAACMVAVDATHWEVYVNKGTWTLTP